MSALSDALAAMDKATPGASVGCEDCDDGCSCINGPCYEDDKLDALLAEAKGDNHAEG